MCQRQFTIIPHQLLKMNHLRRVVSIIALAMMMALALPPDSVARSGGHSSSHRSSSAGYSRATRTPSTSKAAPSSASDQALSRQAAKGALTALRAADAARKASTAVVLPPSSQSRRPSTAKHHQGSRGFFDRVDLDLDDVVEAVVPLFTTRAPTVVVVNNAPNAAVTSAAVPIAAATTAAVAAAPAAAAPAATSIAASAGSVLSAIVTALIMLVLIGGLIGAVVLWWLWRRRRSATPSAVAARPSARSQLFRVGMTLPVDPSLFILAAPYTTVTAPEAATASGFLSVEQVGRVDGSGQTWYRLYVANGKGFFQVHLDAAGQPDECRYFSQLDEVAPADAEEWRVWLDQTDGLLGEPVFATKDGQHYQRHWSPGTTHIAPHLLTEMREPGGAQRHEQAMLYARLTGAPAPAPVTEYLLVQALEQPDAAWIALQVGIDIPLAALQLS